jgi:hypothetical protein
MKIFSSARTARFWIDQPSEYEESFIGNTIRNPPSQSSNPPQHALGKDLSPLIVDGEKGQKEGEDALHPLSANRS